MNQPLSLGGPCLSLVQFTEFALLSVGSSFTVAVTEEKRDTASVTEMADAPKHTHIMAVTPEHVHKMAATTKAGHVIAAIPESSQVTADLPESKPKGQSFMILYSVRDAPLVSSLAAGMPKPVLTNTSVPEVIPLSAALPIWGIAFYCLWAAFTTTEVPEPATSMEALPVVAAKAMFTLGVFFDKKKLTTALF
ncbi:hypothetical protein M9458_051919 [Cirrhinus mrigala]|uniref:Uncharacterized protein n=1 Tax=Cirrhinus mrigala TaxID=683832 RepID=A0ABD0MUG4_CIRMR